MELPARFGKYELLEHLATGGMAEVYLARSFGVEGFQKNVVIKRILPALSSSPRFVNMFVNEAKITAGLSHPNIVQLYEVALEKNTLHFVFEYLDLNVYQLMKERKKLFPEALIRNIMFQSLQGLTYMHKQNYLHRDLKPENLLCYHQTIKIADFG